MNPPPPVPSPKQRRGPLFYISLAAAVLFMAVTVVVLGARYAVNSAIAAYTAAKPVKLPRPALTADGENRLENKFEDFDRDFRANRPATLELSGPELSAALDEHTAAGGRVVVALEDGKLRGRVSLPLDATGWKELEGRWLNGDATLDLGGADGRVWLRVVSLTVNGRPLPAPIFKHLAALNLVEEAAADGRTAAYLSRIESVAVEKEGLVVKFKGK